MCGGSGGPDGLDRLGHFARRKVGSAARDCETGFASWTAGGSASWALRLGLLHGRLGRVYVVGSGVDCVSLSARSVCLVGRDVRPTRRKCRCVDIRVWRLRGGTLLPGMGFELATEHGSGAAVLLLLPVFAPAVVRGLAWALIRLLLLAGDGFRFLPGLVGGAADEE